MMSSATSTDTRAASADANTFRPWHFYLLLSMCGATGAVVLSPHTHPVALLLVSAAAIATGFAGYALHYALTGFWGGIPNTAPLPARVREGLERDKTLVLRSLKELEFDRAMGKIGDADYAEISGRLRARAIELMQELDRVPLTRVTEPGAPAPAAVRSAAKSTVCPACDSANDVAAKFCSQCGAKL